MQPSTAKQTAIDTTMDAMQKLPSRIPIRQFAARLIYAFQAPRRTLVGKGTMLMLLLGAFIPNLTAQQFRTDELYMQHLRLNQIRLEQAKQREEIKAQRNLEAAGPYLQRQELWGEVIQEHRQEKIENLLRVSQRFEKDYDHFMNQQKNLKIRQQQYNLNQAANTPAHERERAVKYQSFLQKAQELDQRRIQGYYDDTVQSTANQNARSQVYQNFVQQQQSWKRTANRSNSNKDAYWEDQYRQKKDEYAAYLEERKRSKANSKKRKSLNQSVIKKQETDFNRIIEVQQELAQRRREAEQKAAEVKHDYGKDSRYDQYLQSAAKVQERAADQTPSLIRDRNQKTAYEAYLERLSEVQTTRTQVERQVELDTKPQQTRYQEFLQNRQAEETARSQTSSQPLEPVNPIKSRYENYLDMMREKEASAQSRQPALNNPASDLQNYQQQQQSRANTAIQGARSQLSNYEQSLQGLRNN